MFFVCHFEINYRAIAPIKYVNCIILNLCSYCLISVFLFLQIVKMLKPEIEEVQLRCILLFLFDKGLKPKEATKNINETYIEILNIRKCQRWFEQFKNDDRNLKNKLKSGKPQTIDDVLKSLMESDPRKTIGKGNIYVRRNCRRISAVPGRL